MGAYKRKLSKGVRWFFSGQHLNTKYHSKAIYLTKGECLTAERVKLQELDRQARTPTKEVKLWDLFNERLDYLKLKKSDRYYRENKRYFSLLYQEVGDVYVHEVSKSTINKLLFSFSADLKKRGKTYHKANAMLRTLKALFNYGIKLHDLDIKNPCTGLDLYSVDDKLKYIPSDEEINAVLRLCEPHQKRLVQFVIDTGARINEPLNLTYGDVFDDYVVLYTRKSKNSNLSARKVPKPRCINGYKGKPHQKVFPEWTSYPKFLERKVSHLKHTPWGWHNLRHRYASRLSKEGRPLFEIMMLLGHQNISTTQKYLQLLP